MKRSETISWMQVKAGIFIVVALCLLLLGSTPHGGKD